MYLTEISGAYPLRLHHSHYPSIIRSYQSDQHHLRLRFLNPCVVFASMRARSNVKRGNQCWPSCSWPAHPAEDFYELYNFDLLPVKKSGLLFVFIIILLQLKNRSTLVPRELYIPRARIAGSEIFWEVEWEEVRIIHLSLFRVSCSLEPIDFDSRLRFCSSAGVDWGKACTHRRGWETCDARADAGRLSELAHQRRHFHEMASATDRKWGQSGYGT